MQIYIKKLHDDVEIPQYATPGSAGLDISVRMSSLNFFTLQPNQSHTFSTGLEVFIKDPNYAGILLPRSGLGTKQGIVLGNLTGLIDSDYQGEIFVNLWNRTQVPYHIKAKQKVAQLVIVPVKQVELVEVGDFGNATQRRGQGFGSTDQ